MITLRNVLLLLLLSVPVSCYGERPDVCAGVYTQMQYGEYRGKSFKGHSVVARVQDSRVVLEVSNPDGEVLATAEYKVVARSVDDIPHDPNRLEPD